MNFEIAIFYFFATIVTIAGLLVILVRNPVHAALFLVLTFFACAGVWLLLEAEFLAVTLVVVYVGAVMVLFLFVVMMLDINLVPLREGFTRYLPVGGLIALVIIVELVMVLGPDRFGLDKVADPAGHAASYSNSKELGRLLYTEYVYPLEIAALILVVAIIAAIVLTMRTRRQTKYMAPEDQVRVKRNDRVRMVQMPSEKKQKP